jgi:hypothetical protein
VEHEEVAARLLNLVGASDFHDHQETFDLSLVSRNLQESTNADLLKRADEEAERRRAVEVRP